MPILEDANVLWESRRRPENSTSVGLPVKIFCAYEKRLH